MFYFHPDRTHLWHCAIFGLATLAACESPSAHRSRVPARPATTSDAAMHLPPHSADSLANQPKSSPVPLPDSTVKISKTVAPGLVVTIRGTYVTDHERIRANPQRILLINQCGQVIYTDTTTDFLYDQPFKASPYPIWLPTGRNRGELVLYVAGPLDPGRRFFVDAGHTVKVDTLPIFTEKARNLDKDPALELSGYNWPGPAERWDSAGYSWTTYKPRLYYEIRATGLVLDSALTKQKALAWYGIFRGFAYLNKPKIRLR